MPLTVYAAEITYDGVTRHRSIQGRAPFRLADAVARVAAGLFHYGDDVTVSVRYVRTVPDGTRVTKWELVSQHERDQLDAQPFRQAVEGGEAEGRCGTCGEPLPTEGAFARHFTVPDYRLVNLGKCPNGKQA